eukprot:7390494-Pyramimonas_sp.AAC.1
MSREDAKAPRGALARQSRAVWASAPDAPARPRSRSEGAQVPGQELDGRACALHRHPRGDGGGRATLPGAHSLQALGAPVPGGPHPQDLPGGALLVTKIIRGYHKRINGNNTIIKSSSYNNGIILLRAPSNFETDTVKYTGSCASAMPQSRGFRSPSGAPRNDSRANMFRNIARC